MTLLEYVQLYILNRVFMTIFASVMKNKV